MMERASVAVLGTRGSVPVEGEKFERFGRATTCFLIRLAGQPVVVDAGTGILQLTDRLRPEELTLPLILTHAHVDHLMGLGMCPAAFRRDMSLRVYGVTREGLAVRDQLERLYSPPLWPVGPAALPADFTFLPLEPELRLGPVTVRSLEGVHPGGVSLLRLSGGGREVAVLTDCTLDTPRRAELLDFARDCDLLLVDGQYAPEEWRGRESFGHSTWEQAARFGRDCGARQVRIVHHDPDHDDLTLSQAEAALTVLYPRCRMARGGEEIEL